MKNLIAGLNKAFDNKVRLGVMSVLMARPEADFSTLKETLEVTDGNLASHLKALEKEQYIDVHKKFVGRKPNTTYEVNKKGKNAFEAHIDALEAIIKNQKH